MGGGKLLEWVTIAWSQCQFRGGLGFVYFRKWRKESQKSSVCPKERVVSGLVLNVCGSITTTVLKGNNYSELPHMMGSWRYGNGYRTLAGSSWILCWARAQLQVRRWMGISNLEVVKYLWMLYSPRGEYTWVNAAKGGHLEFLKWTR